MDKTTIKRIKTILGKSRVLSDHLSLIAYAADAGCYRKIPQLVANPDTEEQVIQLLEYTHQHKIPLTFRAAGTSLSGQSISDSLLVQARGDKWSRAEVLENGKYVKVQPGITGSRLNQILKPYKVKFGPDPASINSAMVGGIIANNASGMSCGIHANSYATIVSARIVFADGTLLDTASEESRKSFLQSKSGWVERISKIRDFIRSKPERVEKIKNKYSIKNTTGYGLNSFVDFDDPIDIILHLMVGSEGTLGFISEAVFRTIEDLPFRASSMIYFTSLKDACDAVPKLKEAGVPAIELLDREALRSVEDQNGIPEFIRDFDNQATALLIDLEAGSEENLETLITDAQKAIESFDLLRDFEITRNPMQIAGYWKIRKGVFPSVGGMRKPGTSVIIEDIAVSMDKLTATVLDLRKMLDDLDYKDAVIYGHALDGNLHFIFAQDFNDSAELEKYRNMIEVLCDMIVTTYDGSLKAEHGTGMNMAPFVQLEWGEELYQVMREIKNIVDPDKLLNPDVIITDDPNLHLKNFKPLTLVDETVDQCIECGFCEINCLTTGYSLSARQRIVVQREIHRLSKTGEDPLKMKMINREFRFMGNASCAGDGLCSISCPLSIDTGVFIKKYRNKQNQHKPGARKLAVGIANNFNTTVNLVRAGLGMVGVAHKVLGTKVLSAISGFITFVSFNHIIQWNRHFPKSVRVRAKDAPQKTGNTVVYFPSCINQSMGPSYNDTDQRPLSTVTTEVLKRAGYSVVYPENIGSLCCGTPWESKGFLEIADQKSDELEEALMKVSENGKYPVLCDTSPCVYRMKKVMNPALSLYEPVEFAHEFLLKTLDFKQTDKKIAIHITCSSTKMELQDKFLEVAKACSKNIVVPQEVGCCGFAGDKGFSQPKLNDHALRKLKPQLQGCTEAYSNSRTCEIGLSKNIGIDYRSIMYLIDETTK